MASLLVLWGASAGMAARAAGLRVIPFPGTPDASCTTDVIFSALGPSDLRAVTVTGSRSGVHRGRIRALPAASGTEFIPDRRFTAGESVHVTADLGSTRAGTASGDPGATRLSFAFSVGVPPARPAFPQPASGPGLDLRPGWMSRPSPSASIQGPTRSFRSEPGLHPPVLNMTPDPDPGSGDIFAGITAGPQFGPMILNPQGQLVWFLPDRRTDTFAVQRYEDHPVLTWFQASPPPPEDVIMDRSYRTLAIVRAGNGFYTDPHDFQLTSRGTAFLTAIRIIDANLSSVGGPPDGTVHDDAIQEVDVKTGQVLWEWHALGHLPLSASYVPAPRKSGSSYDPFHINSIQQLPDGNLLISARNTWSVYEISRKTGKVIWTLGGKYSNFAMGPGTRFEWQHDPRLHSHILSLFDDAATPQEESQSSAKLLRVDTQKRTVSLIRRYTHSPPLLAGSLGSVQTLPNDNVFVGWGAVPEFSEYTPGGRQILNGAFPFGLVIYRILRFPWIGRPRTRPSVAVSRTARGHTTVYASWNGATQVSAWRLVGGPSPGHLRRLGVTAVRTGFETTIHTTRHPRYLAVQALGRRGNLLATSAPAQAGR